MNLSVISLSHRRVPQTCRRSPTPTSNDNANVTTGAPPTRARSRQKRSARALVLGSLAAVVAIAVGVGLVLALTRSNGKHDSRAAGGAHAKTPAVLTASSVWRGLPSMPTARQQVGATVSHGVAWIFGGLTNGAATKKVEGYDPAISTWESGPNLPLALHHELAVVYRGEMVVMGGWFPAGSVVDGNVSNRVFVLRNDAWVELPPMNHARAAGAAAVVGDKIIVTGGQANHELVTQTEVFDGTKWTDVANIPTPRDHLAGVANRRYFFAVGGRALSADKNLGAVERYDPATNLWVTLPSLPTPRGGLGAAIVGRRLVTLGGEGPTSVFNTVESLDLRTNTWTTLPVMKTPRHGMAVLSVGDAVYAIGGAGAPGHTDSVTTNEAVDMTSFPTASPWRVLPSMPTARQQVGATVSQGMTWIFGGLTNGAATKKVEGYDPAISTWTSGPPLPLALHHEMAVVYRGEMVVMGGWYPAGSESTRT